MAHSPFVPINGPERDVLRSDDGDLIVLVTPSNEVTGVNVRFGKRVVP